MTLTDAIASLLKKLRSLIENEEKNAAKDVAMDVIERPECWEYVSYVKAFYWNNVEGSTSSSERVRVYVEPDHIRVDAFGKTFNFYEPKLVDALNINMSRINIELMRQRKPAKPK